MTPDQKARVSIDALQQAGWHVCDMAHANSRAARGVALREFPLNPGYRFADCLFYIGGKAVGVIEVKKRALVRQQVGRANVTGAKLQALVVPLPLSV